LSQLSSEQLNHFWTFGFLIFRQLFSPEEVERYRREFDAGLEAWNDGPHDGATRLWAPLMDSNTPFIASLTDDPRFADVAEQLLGKPVLGYLTDGNYYVGDTRWHPDGTLLEAIKFTIYLDALDANSGALRVVPGSHHEPLHSLITRETQAVFGVRPDEVPAHVNRILVTCWYSIRQFGTHPLVGTIFAGWGQSTIAKIQSLPNLPLLFKRRLGATTRGI
jgi:hypothetical protein